MLLGILLLAFLLPMFQQVTKLFDEGRPLDGYFAESVDTSLTLSNWFERKFQDKEERYLNERFGFRSFLVRLNNQICFSLFDEIRVQYMFRGKEGYMFTTDFLNSYSGRTFVGKKAHADSVFNSVEQLNEFLRKKDKTLLVCVAPCKESFYPEYLPDTCRQNFSEENYYNYYRAKFAASKIPFIDYHEYFQKLKLTEKYPLFTQGALHWTTYGACIALDTLMKRVRYETGKNVNLIRWKSVEEKVNGNDDDVDQNRALNILANINQQKLAYPQIEHVFFNDSCYRPKVLIVGDSFFYGLNNTWIPLTFFSNESYFLYYYRDAISYGGKPSQEVASMNMKKELDNTDVVILFFTIGNLHHFPYGATAMMN